MMIADVQCPDKGCPSATCQLLGEQVARVGDGKGVEMIAVGYKCQNCQLVFLLFDEDRTGMHRTLQKIRKDYGMVYDRLMKLPLDRRDDLLRDARVTDDSVILSDGQEFKKEGG